MIQLGRSPIPGQGKAANPGEHRLSYQPALDGIRALAVAAVLAYHAGLSWARGGFLGVDAFFVLSGYLITSLLLAEWRTSGRMNLAAFWGRRARRLLPALFLMLIGVAGYAVIFAEPEELGKLRGDALATLGYVANWWPVFSGESYFDQFSAPSPLRHTWSLAIEEQWYAVWPLLVLVVLRLRRGSLGGLLTVSLVMVAGSALLMGWLHDPRGDPSRVYYGTDTRAQSLLVGAVLAMLVLQHGPLRAALWRRMLQVAGVACAVYIGWTWVTTSDDSVFMYRGGLLLLAVAVAVVIAAAVQPKAGLLSRALSLAPLRGLGLISYGVYLWHWPVYLVLTPDRTGWDGYGLFAARVLVTLAISVASYHFVETPLRRGALLRWRASWTLAPAGAAGLAVALVLMTRGGEPTLAVSTSSSPPIPPSVSVSEVNGTGAVAGAPVRVLVVGDSVALTMAQGLERAESSWNLSVWNTGTLGCGVLRGDAILFEGKWTKQKESCNDWPSRWGSYVEVFEPDVAVVLVGAWDTYDREVGGRLLEFGTAEADAYALSELDEAVDVLSSGGARVVLLTTPYFTTRDLALAVANPRFESWRIDRLNDFYRELAEQRPGEVSVVDLNQLVSPAGEHTDVIDGIEMRGDGVHFTPEGADAVARWLAPEIVAVSGNEHRAVREAEARDDGGSNVQPPSRWLELLAQVPDTSDTRSWTVMNDYARFRAAFDISLPAADADEDRLFEYYRWLLFDEEGKGSGLMPVDITGIRKFPPPLSETRTELGFTIADVDQDVWAGEAGPDSAIQILRGRFDQGAIDSAVHSDPLFGDLLEVTSHSGVDYYAWGGDSEASSDRASPVRTLGRGNRLALRGDYLYWSLTTEGVEAMIDAGTGEGGSLADVDEFRLLAEGLDLLSTYTALFSDNTGYYTAEEVARRVAGRDASEQDVEAMREVLEGQPQLLAYQAFASGGGVDADGPYTAVVLLNPDEEVALENARRLKDRIKEGTSWLGGQPFSEFIDGVEILTDGRLVLATLRTDELGFWFGLHAAGDTLLLHE
jgi:peptidoglycan/LPS O-acetylase OafA/YrhL